MMAELGPAWFEDPCLELQASPTPRPLLQQLSSPACLSRTYIVDSFLGAGRGYAFIVSGSPKLWVWAE